MKKNIPQQIKRYENLNKNFKIFKKDNIKEYEFHYHDFYEFELILSGKGLAYVNGVGYHVKKGSAYLLRPTDLHELKFSEPVSLYSLSIAPEYFNSDLFNDFTQKNTFLLTDFSEIDLNLTTSFCEKLYSETDESDKPYNEIIAHYALNSILALLLEKTEKSNFSQNDDPIFKSIRYVNENFTHNPNLSEVAYISGFTENYFCRKFKKETGKTYHEYLTQLKIDFAKRLLKSTNTPIIDILFSCGFESSSQFIREFKKREKIAPSIYRKLNRTN